MDLLPSAEQDEIAATVAAFLADRLPLEGRGDVFVDEGTGIDPAVWSACCELGWLSLGLPEEVGGVGYGLAEEALLFRELGRGVAPGPFLPGVLAAHLAATAGDTDLVALVIDGSTVVALGTPLAGATVGATVDGAFSVVHAAGADLVLVVDASGAALVGADALELEPVDPIDGAVPVARARAGGVPAEVFLPTAAGSTSIHDRGLVLAAAMAAGIADGVTRAAVEYAKVRVQFGKPIGTFQAIKHRCADMAVAAEEAFAQVCYAAVALRDGDDAGVEAAIAKYHADAAAQLATDGAVQIHGAIGFTSETTPHRFVYRANLLRTVLANRVQLLDRVLPAPGGDR